MRDRGIEIRRDGGKDEGREGGGGREGGSEGVKEREWREGGRGSTCILQ